MKNKAQIVTFKLSVLATFMLCTTANNYASDIEIYKAPTRADGNAQIMFVLDVSTYMYESPDNSGGSGGGNSGISSASPIPADFGFSCPSNKASTEVRYANTTYSYDASYCETTTATAKVIAGCDTTATQLAGATPAIPTGTYRCYDRLSRLKRALFEVIDDSRYSAEEAAADPTGERPRISLGFSFYPLVSTFGPPLQPTLLNEAGRIKLKERLSKSQLPPPDTSDGAKTAQVAQAYGRGVNSLIAAANTNTSSNQQCSGYGVYMVSGRNPDSDIGTNNVDSNGYDGALLSLNKTLNTDTKNSNPLGSVCSWGNSSSSNGTSWKCVEKAAELLMANKSLLHVPIRTAVVSMGGGLTDAKELGTSFAFYDVDARTDFSKYGTRTITNADGESIKVSTTLADVDADYNRIKVNYASPLLEDRRYAIRTGVAGDGGYFAVSNVTALRKSIDDFILKTLKVDIPYITTGAPTIPQDPLNPSLVQNDAYYSQFKPTPKVVAEDANRLWVGNMKKYHVNTLGRLVGKNNSVIGAAEEKEAVTDALGRLITGTHDYWAPNVSEDPIIAAGDETVWGSELYARMGGMKSQLPLGLSAVDATVENRKLLTNRVITGSVVSKGTMLTRVERKNYVTGAAAENDPKKADIQRLLDLRQVGAMMHSSPLLVSNEGKISYNTSTQQLESSGREDYVLFGSTQGLLHVVKADDYSSGNGGGKEVFAFVPHEMIENQSAAFRTPEETTGGTAALFYGIDAPWTTHTEYVPKSDGTLTVGTGKTTDTTTLKGKQWVYGGLRMGGRSYYALDLGNMNDPKLKFHIDPDAATSGTPLSYMGESWSKPKMAWVNWQGTRKLVMFVGGGYDAGGATGKANNGGYEFDSYAQANGIGAGVYMFDADTGALLWWASNNATDTTATGTNSGVIALKDANMKYSVVSDIKTADRDNDGLVDHLYFGDLGGQVFRIDLNNKATTIGAFATRSTRLLNMHASSGASPRFYSAPSFAIFKDSATSKLFAAISIGSGNLSHPLAGYTSGRENDALYTIYDKDVARTDLATATSMNTQDVAVGAAGSLALNELTMANRFQQSAASVAPYATSAGWYYQLNGGTQKQHEKIFYSPTVIDHDLYVSSYDASRLGLTGACGGGVQGVSKVQLFCMPFGQCLAADDPSGKRTNTTYSDDHGPGIQNHAIASGGDGTTRLVGGAIIGNNLTDQYGTKIKFIPQRWYER